MYTSMQEEALVNFSCDTSSIHSLNRSRYIMSGSVVKYKRERNICCSVRRYRV